MKSFTLPCVAFIMMCVEVDSACDVLKHSGGADIVFLIDSSGSVGERNFKKQLRFVSQLANTIPIGPRDNQLGLETFSTDIHHHLSLKDHWRNSGLRAAIEKIPYNSGGTNTGKALRYVLSQSFNDQRGGRRNVPHILIVTTDGRSNIKQNTLQAALEVHKRNITSICIGIGNNTDRTEIYAIASNRQNAVFVHDFSALLTTVLNMTLSIIHRSTCSWNQSANSKSSSPEGGAKLTFSPPNTTTESEVIAPNSSLPRVQNSTLSSSNPRHEAINAKRGPPTQGSTPAISGKVTSPYRDAVASTETEHRHKVRQFLFKTEAEISILVLVSLVLMGLSLCCCRQLFLFCTRKSNDDDDEEKNAVRARPVVNSVTSRGKIFPNQLPPDGPLITFPSSYTGIINTEW